MFRTIVFCIAVCGGLSAGLPGQEDGCPDQVVATVKPVVTAEYLQSCGSNLSTTVGGVSITTPMNICPLLVIIRPGHDTTIERPGSGTYTLPVKTVPIVALNFECEESWLIGLIPIVVSSHCVAEAERAVGVVTHYEQASCSGPRPDRSGLKVRH